MKLEPWMLAKMEEGGILDTKEGQINRLANYFRKNGYTYVGNDEFMDACRELGLDPYSFSKSDLAKIEEKANR